MKNIKYLIALLSISTLLLISCQKNNYSSSKDVVKEIAQAAKEDNVELIKEKAPFSKKYNQTEMENYLSLWKEITLYNYKIEVVKEEKNPTTIKMTVYNEFNEVAEYIYFKVETNIFCNFIKFVINCHFDCGWIFFFFYDFDFIIIKGNF
ncbi:MAG: hypothetical protein K5866_01500, partial [Treponema sp.]|nr:hypothetical protein [Treponema sp.]